jgi:hypothetical protein
MKDLPIYSFEISANDEKSNALIDIFYQNEGENRIHDPITLMLCNNSGIFLFLAGCGSYNSPLCID